MNLPNALWYERFIGQVSPAEIGTLGKYFQLPQTVEKRNQFELGDFNKALRKRGSKRLAKFKRADVRRYVERHVWTAPGEDRITFDNPSDAAPTKTTKTKKKK